MTQRVFNYDTAGRTASVVTSAGTTSVAYDYEGRITTITYPNLSTNTFAYNGLDTRVSKVDSTGTRTYMRDGAYVTDPVLSDGAAGYTPGISERRSGTTKFYHQDRLGTTERLTNTSQATTDTRQYDAFGLLVASTGSTPTPFGFAGAHGYQEDPDSGLKLLGHRYYDPSTGRFLTRDPIKDGRNWYGYCEANPQNWLDPAGLAVFFGFFAEGSLLFGGRVRAGVKIYSLTEWTLTAERQWSVGANLGGGGGGAFEWDPNDGAPQPGWSDIPSRGAATNVGPVEISFPELGAQPVIGISQRIESGAEMTLGGRRWESPAMYPGQPAVETVRGVIKAASRFLDVVRNLIL